LHIPSNSTSSTSEYEEFFLVAIRQEQTITAACCRFASQPSKLEKILELIQESNNSRRAVEAKNADLV
jgi:hypothetical protein